MDAVLEMELEVVEVETELQFLHWQWPPTQEVLKQNRHHSRQKVREATTRSIMVVVLEVLMASAVLLDELLL